MPRYLSYLRKIEFILKQLGKNKLVIYGELHGRKKSWDLLRSVIASSDFNEYTGTIFMELAVNSQEALDRFLSNKNKDNEIILDILRKEHLMGWDDRGMYEFILSIWDVNNKLPEGKK